MVSRRSATEGRALVGYRPASGKARTNASTAAGPGPSGFSLLLILISAGSADTAASPGGDPARAASRPRAAIRAAGSGAPPKGPTRFRNERRESDMTPPASPRLEHLRFRWPRSYRRWPVGCTRKSSGASPFLQALHRGQDQVVGRLAGQPVPVVVARGCRGHPEGRR